MFPFGTIPHPAVRFDTTPAFSAQVHLIKPLLFQRRHSTLRAEAGSNLRAEEVSVALTTVTRDSASLATRKQISSFELQTIQHQVSALVCEHGLYSALISKMY